MSATREDLLNWLNDLPEGALVGIDDGGLTLCEVGGDDYYEVGGMPEEEN